jgi:hypothetical protein
VSNWASEIVLWLRAFAWALLGLALLVGVLFSRMSQNGLQLPVEGRSLLWGVLVGALVLGAGMAATASLLLNSH